MGEKIAFKNGQISDFQGPVTLTLDQVILYTVMHHSLKSKKLFVDGRNLYSDAYLHVQQSA